MESSTNLYFRELPGTTSLFRDYLYNYPNLAEFFPGTPQNFSNYKYRHEIVSQRTYQRKELVDVLLEQNKLYGAPEKTIANIKKLLDPKTCAIVTGQQVGLFGGPLFTLYKAITTIKLAEKVNSDYDSPVVPVFWLASDDADLKEALYTNIINKENQFTPVQFDLNGIPEGTPAAEVKINSSIQTLLDSTFAQLFDSEFKEQVKTKLSACYKEGNDVATAFAQWMTQLLGEQGLIFLNPADARIKKLGLPLFEAEIRKKSPSTQWVKQSSELLQAKEYHRQLSLHENALNLFYNEQGRKSLKLENDSVVIQGSNEKISIDDFCKRIQQHPEKISPNVVLRALFQDTVLPTISYSPGPNELAYFAQLSSVYTGFHTPMPIMIPRASVTLLENKIAQTMEKYNIAIKDVFGNVEQLVSDVLRRSLPENLESEFKDINQNLDKLIAGLQSKVEQWEPTLVKAVETSGNSMKYQIDSIEKKIFAAHKKKNETIRQQIYKIAVNLYPNGNYQERELNILPYLCKYGFAFIPDLVNSIQVDNFEHQVIKL